MFRNTLLYFLIILLMLWKPIDTSYTKDTPTRMRYKIYEMEIELVSDVVMKIKAIQPFKELYRDSIVFQVGQMLHYIELKMNYMVKVYTITNYNVHTSQNVHTDPQYKTFNTKENVNNMAELDRIASHLCILVDMLEEWDSNYESKEDTHKRMVYWRSGMPEYPDDSLAMMKAYYDDHMKKGKKTKNHKWTYANNDGLRTLFKTFDKFKRDPILKQTSS